MKPVRNFTLLYDLDLVVVIFIGEAECVNKCHRKTVRAPVSPKCCTVYTLYDNTTPFKASMKKNPSLSMDPNVGNHVPKYSNSKKWWERVQVKTLLVLL